MYIEASLYIATGNLITRKVLHFFTSNNAVLASSDNTIRTVVVYKNDMFYAPVHGNIMKHRNVLHFSSLAYNTDAEKFIAINEVLLDMSVDWVEGKLYWTTTSSTIYCSNIDYPKIAIVASEDSGSLGRFGGDCIASKISVSKQ